MGECIQGAFSSGGGNGAVSTPNMITTNDMTQTGGMGITKINSGDNDAPDYAGLDIFTGGTQASSITLDLGAKFRAITEWVKTQDWSWSCSTNRNTQGSDYTAYVGLSLVTTTGTGITFTTDHAGVKEVRASSGTAVDSATVGNGTTETAAVLTGLSNMRGDILIRHTADATESILFYHDFLLVATITTNLPDTTVGDADPSFYSAISNMNVASDTRFRLQNYSLVVEGTPHA